MRTARLVFVSTPYASIECKDRDRNYYAKQLALEACAIVRKNGYEPISPVLAFMDTHSEFEREVVMKNCEELLRVCSYYYYHECKFSKTSKGMATEREWAKEYGLTELKFSLFE
ncbi:hypothetical protein FFA43_01245 [Campylobacter hyointestinalis subsp. hyointestinalis]|uniref:DUF7768 domain-containing protein n=1 Tax=Campylobacter hyointestinalis TaxID=198 RepID=UPI000CE55D0A|nr:hypothetical protein [Campylobacter hyointestinalis]PPB57601.1 hypothetical protein CDQ71_06925 [Campylobacter hyointestinalis subsp. hyointestinalis]QCT99340.1 hypothetical protein FFA43_01245 [Campylobacter hyointestinalis subsp. hyointestinalis]